MVEAADNGWFQLTVTAQQELIPANREDYVLQNRNVMYANSQKLEGNGGVQCTEKTGVMNRHRCAGKTTTIRVHCQGAQLAIVNIDRPCRRAPTVTFSFESDWANAAGTGVISAATGVAPLRPARFTVTGLSGDTLAAVNGDLAQPAVVLRAAVAKAAVAAGAAIDFESLALTHRGVTLHDFLALSEHLGVVADAAGGAVVELIGLTAQPRGRAGANSIKHVQYEAEDYHDPEIKYALPAEKRNQIYYYAAGVGDFRIVDPARPRGPELMKLTGTGPEGAAAAVAATLVQRGNEKDAKRTFHAFGGDLHTAGDALHRVADLYAILDEISGRFALREVDTPLARATIVVLLLRKFKQNEAPNLLRRRDLLRL